VDGLGAKTSHHVLVCNFLGVFGPNELNF